MREKLDYEKKRHREIRIDGRKAKLLGYSFFVHHADGAECILLKTKMPGNYPADLARSGERVYRMEIPTEGGVLTVGGRLRTVARAPGMAEYGFEIVTKTLLES